MNIQQRQKGFTLIELMVSVTIFAIVLVISIGAILSIVDANRKAQALTAVMNNLNAAVDSMSRTISTGFEYGDVSGTSFTFKDASNQTVQYRLEDEQILVTQGGTTIALTAPEVSVENLTFYVHKGVCLQPRVIMVVQGIAGVNDKVKTDFNIQTTVSQRNLDIDSYSQCQNP